MSKVNKTTQHAIFISIQRNSDLSATVIIVTYNRNCWGNFLFSAHQISVVCGYDMIWLKILNALWEIYFIICRLLYDSINAVQDETAERFLRNYFCLFWGDSRMFIRSVHFLWHMELKWERFCYMFMNSFSTQI